MQYNVQELRDLLSKRYWALLNRLSLKKELHSSPSIGFINRLVDIVKEQGLICHYCNRELDLRSIQGDYKRMLSLDHKVPLKIDVDNSPENIIICCARCNFAKGTMEYEKFKSIVESQRAKSQEVLEKYLEMKFALNTPDKRKVVTPVFKTGAPDFEENSFDSW